MKRNTKIFVIAVGIVVLAGMLFVPVVSAHGSNTTDSPIGPSYDDGASDSFDDRTYTSPHMYRGGCHGGGQFFGGGYDYHQGWGGMMPWFGR